MSMRRLVFIHLGEVGLAAAAAWGANYLFDDLAADLLFGVGTLLTLELITLSLLTHDLSVRVGLLDAVLEALRVSTKFDEVVALYALRPLGIAQRHRLQVDAASVRQLWKDCVSRAEVTWQAVSYIRGDEGWLREWARLATAIQAERLAADCRIERVFIIDSSDELQGLEPTMLAQAQAGVQVSWLLKSDCWDMQPAIDWRFAHGGLDFAIVDGAWVYITRLDMQRQISGAVASREPALLAQARELFLELHNLSARLGHRLQ